MSLYIDGKWIEGKGTSFCSYNPATEKVVWQGNSASEAQVQEAVFSANEAQKSWKNESFTKRTDYCLRFAKLLEENELAIASTISEETGKPLAESLQEVASIRKKVDISIQAIEERCHPTELPMGSISLHTRYKPHGVIAVFGPFNFPGHLPSGHIIPALLAGNSVLFKPSELTPKSGEWITKLWHEAGLPKGVLNLLQGGKEISIHMTSLPDINGIFFTGSAMAGEAISRQSLAFPQRILALEMGGNNPLIVSNTNNIDNAVSIILQSAFLTTGQRCSCARRLILIETSQTSILLKELIKAAQSLKIGSYTENPTPYMGPVISKQAMENLLTAYENLLSAGGKALLPMKKTREVGNFLSPGIVDMTGCKMEDVEHFGPLLQCIRVKNMEEAIATANDTAFGLTAGLISDHFEEYQHFYNEIRAGIINWNTPLTGASSLAPFGGIGKSGNFRPSGYFAADYCSYPVASQEQATP